MLGIFNKPIKNKDYIAFIFNLTYLVITTELNQKNTSKVVSCFIIKKE